MRAVMAEVASRGGLSGLPGLPEVAEVATDHLRTGHALSTATAIALALVLTVGSGFRPDQLRRNG